MKPREADIIQPYKKGTYTGGPKQGTLSSMRKRMDNQSETGKDTDSNIIRTLQTDKYKENRVDMTDTLKYVPAREQQF